MKYINKFSTNADYQAFTEGGGYVTPNICYIEEVDGIVMKPYIAPKEEEYNYNLNIIFDERITDDYAQLYDDLRTICMKYHDNERQNKIYIDSYIIHNSVGIICMGIQLLERQVSTQQPIRVLCNVREF